MRGRVVDFSPFRRSLSALTFFAQAVVVHWPIAVSTVSSMGPGCCWVSVTKRWCDSGCCATFFQAHLRSAHAISGGMHSCCPNFSFWTLTLAAPEGRSCPYSPRWQTTVSWSSGGLCLQVLTARGTTDSQYHGRLPCTSGTLAESLSWGELRVSRRCEVCCLKTQHQLSVAQERCQARIAVSGTGWCLRRQIRIINDSLLANWVLGCAGTVFIRKTRDS